MYFPKEKVLFCLGVVQTIVLCERFYKGFKDWPRTGMTHSNIVSIGKIFWASKSVLQFNFQFYFFTIWGLLGYAYSSSAFCYLCSNGTFSSVYLHGHSVDFPPLDMNQRYHSTDVVEMFSFLEQI